MKTNKELMEWLIRYELEVLFKGMMLVPEVTKSAQERAIPQEYLDKAADILSNHNTVRYCADDKAATKAYAQFWRDDAFEESAKIAERYNAVHAANDIRAMKKSQLPAEDKPVKKVYAVADVVPARTSYLTAGKEYEVLVDSAGGESIVADNKGRMLLCWKCCAHLDGGNWRRVER